MKVFYCLALNRVKMLAFLLILLSHQGFAQTLDYEYSLPKGPGQKLNDVVALGNGHLVAVGECGLVWRTIDGGLNWVHHPTEIAGDLYRIQFLDAQLGYTVGDEGMFQTTDGGTSWTHQPQLPYTGLRSMEWVNDTLAFAGGENGVLHRTLDGGVNWSSVSPALPTAILDEVFFKDELVGFSSWGDEVYRTTDGGSTWATMPGLQLPQATTFGAAAITTGGVTLMYHHPNLFRSTDDGVTWQSSPSPSLWGSLISDFSFQGPDEGYAHTLGAELLKTTDGGLTWTNNDLIGFLNSGYRVGGPIVFTSPDSGFVCGFLAILFTENGGDSLEIRGANILDPGMRDIQMLSPSEAWIAHTDGLHHTVDGGYTWVSVAFPGTGRPVTMNWLTPDSGYVGVDDSPGLFYTTDGGNNWAPASFDSLVTNIGVISFSPNGSTGLAWGNQGLFRSTDGGQSWVWVELQYAANSIEFLDNDIVLFSGGRIGRSVDGGLNWSYSQASVNIGVQKLAVANEDTVYIPSVNNLFFSSYDGGVTWQIDSLLPTNGMREMQFFDGLHGYGIRGNTPGRKLWTTEDGGRTWDKVDMGLCSQIGMDFINPGLGMIIGTYGQVVKVEGDQVVQIANPVENAFQGPVAFVRNGDLVLQYTKPGKGCAVSLCDLTGKQLMNWQVRPGQREVHQSLPALANGIYLLKASGPDEHWSKKVLLMEN